MKTFLGLGDLFLLLSLMWICAGDLSAIFVRCSSNWFFARIKPTVFYNVHMNHDEAFLGNNCPVTYFVPNYYYEFLYHPQACGIKAEILQQVILLKTKLKYVSRNSAVRSEIPLMCVFRNHYPLPIKLGRNREKPGNITERETEARINITDEDTSCFYNTVMIAKGKIIFRTSLTFISKTSPRQG
uniref:Oocyte secreted protein 1 n=1 Tax=Sciurus vulgaris TaxID=55149 RepID=A0A8D2CYT4_SCIVU